jgi:hypothetical protein
MSYIRPVKREVRQTAKPKPVHQTYKFPSPSKGWVTNENLSQAMPGAARVMENWFPTQEGARMRGGSERHATCGGRMVSSLIEYVGSTTQKLFAAHNGGIFDVSSPLSASLTLTADVTGQTSDFYSFQNFATVGGDYVVMVNGTDKARWYDGARHSVLDDATTEIAFDTQTGNFAIGQTVTGGTSSATGVIVSQTDAGATGTLRLKTVTGTFADNEIITDALTGSATTNIPAGVVTIPAVTGVATSVFSHVWTHGNRLWYVEKNTKNAWYMPVDSVGGAALDFSLAGIFQDGGALLFGATWSQDSGAGSDDRCVFVSTMGEVAVYAGTNPASPSDWTLFGRYRMAPPISKQYIKIGGDVLMLTKDGVTPLSAVVGKDPAALRLSAISRNIEPEWRDAVAKYTAADWSFAKWPDKNMMIIGVPGPIRTETLEGDWGEGIWGVDFVWGGGTIDFSLEQGLCFAANLETGAWCKFTGWDAHCFGGLGGALYFGGQQGGVFECESGGQDDGSIIYYRYAAWPDDLGASGQHKQAHMVRMTFRASHPFNPSVSAQTDYKLNFGTPPNAATVNPSGDVWDSAEWDVATYDNVAAKETIVKWFSVGRSGFVLAPTMQISHSSTVTPDVEFISADITFETGAVVA